MACAIRSVSRWWAAVDEVTKEDDLPARMPPGAALLAVAKFAQQPLERVRVAVDVADDVYA